MRRENGCSQTLLSATCFAYNGILTVSFTTMPAAEQTSADARRKAAREVIDILHEIATLLNTHLDRQQLSYCVSLIENGANPEALAKVILQLREEYPASSVDGDVEAGAAAR
ncbi:Mitotic-spindle organizing 1 [Pyrenophora seminiperda CCB06]|uniref:Mitotic-spindle organizing protein 1 n=1 Tax=Pyrenophora seminiperda CCB06 TaxID=1302712 RepID=A0A3M7MEC9_9PLEO|nr:Mitotic-spindle organizing 1 [Pyrenophora seminiperda CCB06]